MTPALLGLDLEPHYQTILHLLPGQRTRDIIETELYQLALKYRESVASDERDKIYALLGLCSDPLNCRPVPDYTTPMPDVISPVVNYFLQSSRTWPQIRGILDFLLTITSLNAVLLDLDDEDLLKSDTPTISHPSRSISPFGSSPEKNDAPGAEFFHKISCFALESRTAPDHPTCSPLFDDVERISRHRFDSLKSEQWGRTSQNVYRLTIHALDEAAMEAMRESCFTLAKRLIEYGTDPNYVSSCRYGRRHPLHIACASGNTECVEALVDRGADVNCDAEGFGLPLPIACAKGNDKMASLLLARAARVNAVSASRGPYYGSALYSAVRSNSESLMNKLLDLGAEVNIKGGTSGPPLHTAVSEGNEKMVRLLLARGADVNKKDSESHTALYFCWHNHLYVLTQFGGFRGPSLSRLIPTLQALVDHGAQTSLGEEEGYEEVKRVLQKHKSGTQVGNS